MNRKRESELEIFKLFYNNRTDIAFEHKDLPDFWVESPFKLKFGVEITELFDNDSEARLSKIPNYIDDLFNERKFRHKDDRQNLNITEITITHQDGKYVANVPAVKYHNIRAEAYLGALLERILEKNRQLNNYSTTLSFHSLVIRDHSRFLLNVERKNVYDAIYKPDLMEGLKQSQFVEIYLVRRYKDGYYSLPLKGFLFLSRLYFFNDVLNAAGIICDDVELHNYFAEMLLYEGFHGVKLRNLNKEVEVVYGNFGILITNQKSITIRDYRESQLPKDELTDPLKSEFISRETIDIFANLNKTFSLEGEFYFKLADVND